MSLSNNIHDVALIFEGGGMRASFSSGIISALLKAELYFNYVTGVSAGASCTINYLSRDSERAKHSFVDLVKSAEFGGWSYFLRGKGYFNASWVYEQSCHSVLPFDLSTFLANPAEAKISAIRADNAETRFWSKAQLSSLDDIVRAVRASSTLPVLMPPPLIDGHYYYDGGLRNGLELETAQRDGCRRFVVVLTQERGYRKTAPKQNRLLRLAMRQYPKLLQLLQERHLHYNKSLDELMALEKAGQAFLIFPERMSVDSGCRSFEALEANYQRGYQQGLKILPDLERFLFA